MARPLKLVCLAAALALLPAGFARTQLPQQAPSNSGPAASGEISGEVVDALTSQPLHKISLHLYPLGMPQGRGGVTFSTRIGGPGTAGPRNYAARSDEAGHFVFPAVPAGEYRLQAFGNEYPTEFYGQEGGVGTAKTLKLTPGQNMDDVRFPLMPGVVITGRVTDEDGDPVEHANVSAVAQVWMQGRLRYQRSGNAQTDDLGEYRIFGLRAGKYYVAVKPGFRSNPAGSSTMTVYAPAFYPGTSDPSQASALDTKPGDSESGIDIMLTPVQPARISGQVVGGGSANGRSPGSFVNLIPAAANGLAMGPQGSAVVRDAQGDFEMDNVPPGQYVLMAARFYPARGERTSPPLMGQVAVTVVPGQDLTNIQLTLNPTLEISGTVTADASPGLRLSSMFVSLIPDSDFQFGGGGARVNQDGTFVLGNVWPGKYRINVMGIPAQYYLKSATFSGQDALDAGLSLVGPGAQGTLAISLGLDGGTIQGSVTGQDNKAVSDATVVLIPDPPHRDRDDLYKEATTNALGMFTMGAIAPGDYKIFSWASIENNAYRDPTFISQYESQGQSTTVKGHGQQSVQLQVIPIEQTAGQ